MRTYFPTPSSAQLLHVRAAAKAACLMVANDVGGVPLYPSLTNSGALDLNFGEFHCKSGTQIFDRESAELLVKSFQAVPVKSGKFFNPGIPIYLGNPDLPGPGQNLAAPAIGWVTAIEIRAAGVTLLSKWGPEGEAARRNTSYVFYSPVWQLRKVAGGWRPIRLISVGLTNQGTANFPTIPLQAANDRAATPAQTKGVLAHLADVKREFPNVPYASQFQLASNRAARSQP